MKRFSIIALILMLAMVFTGCTSNEVELYNAYMKSQDITSMESDMNLKLTLGFEGFPEEADEQLELIANTLKDLEFNIHMKQAANEENTKAQVEMDMGMNLGGMMMNMVTWADVDMSTDAPTMEAIVKMPQMLMTQLSPDGSKEYIVYDYMDMANLGEEYDFNELMDWAIEMEPKILKFMEDYPKNFDPGFEVAKYKDKKEVDGETLSIYEVKLDDANFKELMRYTVNNSMENEDVTKFFKEYMNQVMKLMKSQGLEDEEIKEINEELAKLESSLPEFKDKFNKFMDTIKDVKILGEEGIVIEYGVNKDGYIVKETGKVDLGIDLKAVGEAFGQELISEGAGTIKLGIEFDSKIKNINKEVEINIPEVNEENSINYNDILEQMIEDTSAVETIENK